MLAYAVLVFGFHRVVSSNELTTLPIARSLLDSTVYPRDWFFQSPPLPRLPFATLVSPLTLLLPLPFVAVVLRVVTWALVAWTLGHLFERMRLAPRWWLLVLAIFFGLGQSLFAGEWIFKWVESKVVAYAAVFGGLALAAAGRWMASGLAFGLGITAHALVGGWSGFATGLVLLLLRRHFARQNAPVQWLPWVGALSVGAAPGVLIALLVVFEPSLPNPPWDPVWIYVYFRNPHHLDPAAFDWNAGRVLGSLLVTGYGAYRFARDDDRATRLVAGFVVATMGIAAAGMAVAWLPEGGRLLRFYPFRVGPSAGLLLAIALGLEHLHRALSRRLPASFPTRAVVVFASALIVVGALPGTVRSVDRFLRFPAGAMIGSAELTAPYQEATRWVRENTPQDTLLIASPRYIETAVLSERSMPVHFKGVPASKRGLVEWYRRIVDLAGGREPESVGFRAPAEVDARFNALDVDTYRDLAARYDGDLLFVPPRPDLDRAFERRFANPHWAVYDLRAPITEPPPPASVPSQQPAINRPAASSPADPSDPGPHSE